MKTHYDFIAQAIELAFTNAEDKSSIDFPLGAVIVKNGEVIATGVDLRNSTHELFSYAEVTAMRNAQYSAKIKDLTDCIVYSSALPLESTLEILRAANVKKIYYASTGDDSKIKQHFGCIGFGSVIIGVKNADKITEQGGAREIPMEKVITPNAAMPIVMWTIKNQQKNR